MNPDDPWLLPHLPLAPSDATAVKPPVPRLPQRSVGPAQIPQPGPIEQYAKAHPLMAGVHRVFGPVVREAHAHPVQFAAENLPGPDVPTNIIEGAHKAGEGSWLAGAMQAVGGAVGGGMMAHAALAPMTRAAAKRAVKDEAGNVLSRVFEHYSANDLSGGVLDPKFMGTGKPGREMAFPDRLPMLHVYTAGSRPEPEFHLLPKYDVHVPHDARFYDLADDPEGIAAKVMKDYRAFKFETHPAVMIEKRLKRAGYTGYTDSYNNPEIVKLFGKHPVVPSGKPLSEAQKAMLMPSGSVRLGRLTAAAREAAPAPTTTGTDDAARILAQFQQNSGARNLPRVKAVDPEKAAHMAKLYESLPVNEPEARSAYDALNAEVEKQYQAILDAGHTIEFTDADPYKSSKEMIADVRDNKRLKVFKTPDDNFHPYMTPEQNDKFRAVHDWLAHAGEGHSFGPIGEENAYRVHASTLSPQAQRALATETRGQNSWVNFGPNSHLPVTERPYAPQKAALWPEEFLGDYHEMNTSPFYSRVTRAIDTAPFKKGTAEQWQAQLAKMSNGNERLWTGVDQFLKDNAGKVLTADQVRGAHTPIELGQTTMRDNTEARRAIHDELDRLFRQSAHMELGTPEYIANQQRRVELYQKLKPLDAEHNTKFAQYTLPGDNASYREKLITLGASKAARQARFDALVENGTPLFEALGAVNDEQPLFRSSHFDEPNILAHLRLKDRELPNGEKALHIEELQSDWHQKGRSRGYASDRAPQSSIDAAATRVGNAQRAYQRRLNELAEEQGVEPWRVRGNGDAELSRLGQEFVNADEAHAALVAQGRSGVPDAPFKKTEDWSLLGLKHAIHDAVHGGYDRIAWTPGELQNERYDLSNQVDHLEYDARTGELTAHKDGALVHEGTYDPKALPDVVGKDVADRLLKNKEPDHWRLHFPGEAKPRAQRYGSYEEARADADSYQYSPHEDIAAHYPDVVPVGNSDRHVLSGDELKIQGPGMMGFYNKMLPNNLAKYLKQLGLKDVPAIEHVEAHFNGGDHALEVHQLPSFRITPELRRLVLSKGQPLWAAIPAILGAEALKKDSK